MQLCEFDRRDTTPATLKKHQYDMKTET